MCVIISHQMKKPKTITIYEEGKIDIHKRKAQFLSALDKLKINSSINLENKQLILDFIHDCQLGKTIKKKSKKRIGSARCLKYLGILQKLSCCFGKSFNEVSQTDMENFIINIENGSIKSVKGKPYSEATKVDFKNTIRKFWKWKDGENKYFPELVEWIDTSFAKKDIPALTREEIERMVDYSGNPRNKALLMILFDSGARIEELLNVRLKKEHLFWKEGVGCYMIRLEFSKTKPRTISIPLCTEILNKWLEMHPAKNNPDAQLFPMNYDSLRMFLHRLGKRALNKRVNPHLFRHSSATFYANKLNRYQLCYRYGWVMSSSQVDCYIDREGILEENTAITVKNDEISRANNEALILREELSFVKETNLELSKKFKEIEPELNAIKSGKGIMSILMNLAKQQQEMSEVLQLVSGRKFDIVLPKD